jgi:hypothetical protein
MKCAVVNKETTKVDNIIMASPDDLWTDQSTYLVLVADDLPVDLDDTYDGTNFICKDGNIVQPIPPEQPVEETV